MTIEEYIVESKKLDSEYQKNKNELMKQYAFSQAKFKVGDKIQDPFSKDVIKINRLKCYISFGTPNVLYEGFLLKKDLTVRKDMSEISVFAERNPILIAKADECNGVPIKSV